MSDEQSKPLNDRKMVKKEGGKSRISYNVAHNKQTTYRILETENSLVDKPKPKHTTKKTTHNSDGLTNPPLILILLVLAALSLTVIVRHKLYILSCLLDLNVTNLCGRLESISIVNLTKRKCSNVNGKMFKQRHQNMQCNKPAI